MSTPTLITVIDKVSGLQKQINSADYDPLLYIKLTNDITVIDNTTTLGEIKRTIWFNSLAVAITDNTTNGGAGSYNLPAFPEGDIDWHGCVTDMQLTGSGGLANTAAVVASVGSVAAAADATLSGTEADMLASTAVTLSSLTANMRTATATAQKGNFDGTAGAIVPKLNFAVPDAGILGNGTITITGFMVMNFRLLGDHA
jgi:hypothetical protein